MEVIGPFAGPLFENAKPYALIGDIITRAESFDMYPRRSFAKKFRNGLSFGRRGCGQTCLVS